MIDWFYALLIRILAPVLQQAVNAHPEKSKVGHALNELGFVIYKRHYYHPFITRSDLHHPLNEKRELPGLPLDQQNQRKFLLSLNAIDEMQLLGFPVSAGPLDYDFTTAQNFGAGDADVLYGIVRKYKPSKIIEIGCGDSSKIAQAAIKKNIAENENYQCHHICIEPYEQPWLDELGVEIIRERVELSDKQLFQDLEENDILFIDSSHIIRPQGDVLFEVLELLPTLPKGVLIHIHDIFTPRDYPEIWVLDSKLLWNEQYIVEAFLNYNSEFEICLALNWLTNEIREDLIEKLPGLAWNPGAQPGSLWMRKT